MHRDIHMRGFLCATNNLMDIFYWNKKFRVVDMLKRKVSSGVVE